MQAIQIKQAQQTNQQRIIKMLRWTELEYATFINETGLHYLEAYIPTDRAGIDALNRSRIFWQWWKNHWQIRDAEYLQIVYASDPPETLQRLYRSTHSINVLTHQIYPHGHILRESYAIMIDQFNKSVI